MVSFFRQSMRVSNAGLLFSGGYVLFMIFTLLFNSLLGVVKFISMPGVFLSDQIHKFAVSKGVEWFAALAPQTVVAGQNVTPIMTGTVAAVVLAVLFNVVIYYILGLIVEKYVFK